MKSSAHNSNIEEISKIQKKDQASLNEVNERYKSELGKFYETGKLLLSNLTSPLRPMPLPKLANENAFNFKNINSQMKMSINADAIQTKIKKNHYKKWYNLWF